MIYDELLARNPLHLTRGRLLTRSVAPTAEPLSLCDTKLYLRIDHTHEDSLIGDLIVTARMMCEEWLSRSLMTQSWTLAYDDAIPTTLPLPMGPVRAITSVTVFASDGSSAVQDSASYALNAPKDALIMGAPLIGHRVEIVYSCGFGSSADVPKPIKQGMLAHISALYDQRADVSGTSLPAAAIALYAPYREVRL